MDPATRWGRRGESPGGRTGGKVAQNLRVCATNDCPRPSWRFDMSEGRSEQAERERYPSGHSPGLGRLKACWPILRSNSAIRRADSSVLPSRGAPSTPLGRPVNRRPAAPSLRYTSRQRYSTPRRIPNSSCRGAHALAIDEALRHLQLELRDVRRRPYRRSFVWLGRFRPTRPAGRFARRCRNPVRAHD